MLSRGLPEEVPRVLRFQVLGETLRLPLRAAPYSPLRIGRRQKREETLQPAPTLQNSQNYSLVECFLGFGFSFRVPVEGLGFRP